MVVTIVTSPSLLRVYTPDPEEEYYGMSLARNKLNAASIRDVVLVAGLVALLCQSWQIVWILVAVLLVPSVLVGDIRLGSRRR